MPTRVRKREYLRQGLLNARSRTKHAALRDLLLVWVGAGLSAVGESLLLL